MSSISHRLAAPDLIQVKLCAFGGLRASGSSRGLGIGGFTFAGQRSEITPVNPDLANLKSAALIGALRGCRLFGGLPSEDVQKIAEVTHRKSLEKGDYLFREGEASRGFYIVQSGAVNVHRLTASGKEQVIHVFRAGESFAEIAVVSPTGYPADARATESSQVLLVAKDGFVALLKKQPELALRMLASISGHLRALVEQIEDLTARDVETRLANWLLKRCPDPQSGAPQTLF